MADAKLTIEGYKQIVIAAGKQYGYEMGEYFYTEYQKYKENNPDFINVISQVMWDLRKILSGGATVDFITLDKFRHLETWYLKFSKRVADEQAMEKKMLDLIQQHGSTEQAAGPKLNFIVSNEQVYDVFRVLKKNKWLSGTNEEIANFIFNNIEFKSGETPTLSTIRAEISRDKRPPHAKRFSLPENK